MESWKQRKLINEDSVVLVWGDTLNRADEIARILVENCPDNLTANIIAIPLQTGENIQQLSDKRLEELGLRRIDERHKTT